MKVVLKFITLIFVGAVILQLSCQKELTCENCVATINLPPVANAGNDIIIILPTDSSILDGSTSIDPDGSIIVFLWTKISGPPAFSISDPAAQRTSVYNLMEGTYQFELKVTDAGGLFSTDTMQVTVNPRLIPPPACDIIFRPVVNTGLVPVGTLSQVRQAMAVASAGNKIVFAGGTGSAPSSRVDIYNLVTHAWSTAELSKARFSIAAVAAGNKIFFAGGETGDGTEPVNTVDIYDVSSNTWTVANLSIAGHSIAAASVGNKVFFAGGDGGVLGPYREKTVDIYEWTTNNWSTATLSEDKRGGLSAVTANNKIYFAGGANNGGLGFSNQIDVYDNATNSWHRSPLNESKVNFAGIAVNNKIYWAGGVTKQGSSIQTSCSVEIREVSSGNSSIQYLSSPARWEINSGQNAVLKENKIIFYSTYARNNTFDIYDITTNTWSIGFLNQAMEGSAIISVNNTIYLAGGFLNGVLSSQVWKLEF